MNTLVLNTRPKSQAAELSRAICCVGGEAIEFPVYEIKPSESWEPVRRELATYRSSDWFIFTSANGVVGLVSYLETLGDEHQILRETVHTAVVGAKTAEVARRYGFRPSIVPKKATGEQLVPDLLEKLMPQDRQPKKVFLWRTRGAVPAVKERLEAGGLQVSDVEVYRSVRSDYVTSEVVACFESFLSDHSKKTVLSFTSARGVEYFIEIVSQHVSELLPELLKHPVAVLGEGTRVSAVELGFNSVVLAPENSIEALAKCAVAIDRVAF